MLWRLPVARGGGSPGWGGPQGDSPKGTMMGQVMSPSLAEDHSGSSMCLSRHWKSMAWFWGWKVRSQLAGCFCSSSSSKATSLKAGVGLLTAFRSPATQVAPHF